MMSSLNSATILGNLGKNPEVLNKTDKGLFVKLSVATTKIYRNANKEKVEKTEWHTVTLNNGAADFAAENLKKGDKVLVVGELRTSKYKDKEGIDRYSTAIHASECKLVSKAKAKETITAEAEVEYYEEVA